MSIVIASGMAISTAANTVSAELVTGQYQFIGKGRVTLVARGSATGLNATLAINGIPLMNDNALMFFGATGGLSVNDHVVLSQIQKSGGFLSFKLRNTTGGALTCDYVILYDPM